MGCHVSSLKSYHHVRKSPTAREIKRYIRGGSPLGNGNCVAARSEAGMSRELCIVRTVRARKGAKWVGVLEYRVPPVLYRGGCPLGMQLCVCVLFPYPRISTKTSHLIVSMTSPILIWAQSPLWGKWYYKFRNRNARNYGPKHFFSVTSEITVRNISFRPYFAPQLRPGFRGYLRQNSKSSKVTAKYMSSIPLLL